MQDTFFTFSWMFRNVEIDKTFTGWSCWVDFFCEKSAHNYSYYIDTVRLSLCTEKTKRSLNSAFKMSAILELKECYFWAF